MWNLSNPRPQTSLKMEQENNVTFLTQFSLTLREVILKETNRVTNQLDHKI